MAILTELSQPLFDGRCYCKNRFVYAGVLRDVGKKPQFCCYATVSTGTGESADAFDSKWALEFRPHATSVRRVGLPRLKARAPRKVPGAAGEVAVRPAGK